MQSANGASDVSHIIQYSRLKAYIFVYLQQRLVDYRMSHIDFLFK